MGGPWLEDTRLSLDRGPGHLVITPGTIWLRARHWLALQSTLWFHLHLRGRLLCGASALDSSLLTRQPTLGAQLALGALDGAEEGTGPAWWQ